MMQLTFLGTGTSSGIPVIGCTCKVCLSSNPKNKRKRTAALISVGTKNILIDAGPDIRQQLLEHHISFIDALLITHAHYDHIIGLDELRPLTFQRSLPIFTEKSVHNQLKKIFSYIFLDPLQVGGGITSISVEEIDTNKIFSYDDINITPLRVYHGQLSILGFKINNLAYLTDVKTLPNQTIVSIKNIDTLVISCLREKTHETHLNIEEMLKLVQQINPRICYLVHMDHSLSHEEWTKILPTNIIVSHDDLKINIS
ncbi:MAG: MBL fold metallo-hydrolase [Brevinema sp.]